MTKGTQTRITAKTRFKEMPCRECGKPMMVGSNTRNAPRCVDCGVKAFEESASQMRSKSGPAYDAWRNGIMRATER